MSKIIFFVAFFLSCSHLETPQNPHYPKEFSRGELIMGVNLLTKIYDEEMAPLECIPDAQEAALFLRTIHPRMEIVQDDLEATFDDNKQVNKLIDQCSQECTCSYLSDLFKEHQVALEKKYQKKLSSHTTPLATNRCLNFARTTFCKSELFQELDKEKIDFTYQQ